MQTDGFTRREVGIPVLSRVAIFRYFAAQIVDSIAHSVLGRAWRERNGRRMIDELRDHIIVCGCGRIGRSAADELRTRIATVRKLGGAIDLRPTKDTLLELVDAIVRFGSVDEIRKLELFEPGTAARA